MLLRQPIGPDVGEPDDGGASTAFEPGGAFLPQCGHTLTMVGRGEGDGLGGGCVVESRAEVQGET